MNTPRLPLILVPALASFALALALSGACSGGGSGALSPPPDPQDEPTKLTPTQNAPGVHVAILAASGGSGPDGSFRPGDHVTLHFSLKKNSGGRWNLHEMATASALVSGPSFNYQRVIAEQSDVLTRSIEQSDGSWSYTFAALLPASYLPPYNDSISFGTLEGELTGQALLAGTYSAALAFAWDYSVAGKPFRDAGNATIDFRLGSSAVLTHREVVREENCNRCHVSLRYHEGRFTDVAVCVLCHTSGAEDLNDPTIAAGTRGVSIDFRVLMHKLHNARHQPSVLGVTTNIDGTRNYLAAPRALQYARADGSLADFSFVGFPVWPNRTLPTFKDSGYSALSTAAQAVEDRIRTGITDCAVCHGDPDGAGPLTAPAQGNLAYSEPAQQSCGSCHDDILWQYTYVSNYTGTIPPGMPAQSDSSLCKTCHDPFGSAGDLTVSGSHLHPLKDHLFNEGLTVELSSVSEAGTNDGNGHFDPGEKLQLSLRMKNDSGLDVTASQLSAVEAVLSGPTGNANLILSTTIPKGLLSGTQPFTFRLPEQHQLEFVGTSTLAMGESFSSAFIPHLAVLGATTSVFVRTASGASGELAAATHVPQNFTDLVDAGAFARDDVVVVGDGTGFDEYAKVQLVDGNRLWFSSPAAPAYPAGLSKPHALGASVKQVTLVQKFANVDYTPNTATGTITEITEFGAGAAVLMNYWSDFVVPPRYGLALHDSPDLDEKSGKWSGKSIVSGTYTLSVWGYRSLNGNFYREMNPYFAASPSASTDLLVGSAVALEPYGLIASSASCYACHTDIWYHDGKRRGFETCIACHGTAGAEDLPRYVAANAPSTSAVTTNFRTLLHKIHRGKQLAQAADFQVVGAKSAPWPDNFGVHVYADYLFPAQPGATMQCTKCHGAANTAWKQPADRNHPTEQGAPVQARRAVCAACHDKTSDFAHYDTQTSGFGVEACATCHGSGTQLGVELVHKPR